MAVAFQMFWGVPSVYGPYSTFVKLNALSNPHNMTRLSGFVHKRCESPSGPVATADGPHGVFAEPSV